MTAQIIPLARLRLVTKDGGVIEPLPARKPQKETGGASVCRRFLGAGDVDMAGQCLPERPDKVLEDFTKVLHANGLCKPDKERQP